MKWFSNRKISQNNFYRFKGFFSNRGGFLKIFWPFKGFFERFLLIREFYSINTKLHDVESYGGCFYCQNRLTARIFLTFTRLYAIFTSIYRESITPCLKDSFLPLVSSTILFFCFNKDFLNEDKKNGKVIEKLKTTVLHVGGFLARFLAFLVCDI